jgi:predicted amidohydrolase
MQITLALGQMAVAWAQPDKNVETAGELAVRAAEAGADLLLLPELWATGYDLAHADQYAAHLSEPPFAEMATLAQQHHLWMAGSLLESNPAGPPYNTLALFDPSGKLAGFYRKIHLFPPMEETTYLSPGDRPVVLNLPWGPTGLGTCYDLRFPGLWRRMRQLDARLVLIPAEWPARRVEHWRVLLQARAIENQLVVAGCNRAGADTDGAFGGYSGIIDPWGRILAEADEAPTLLLGRADLSEVEHTRTLFPFFSDRRPEVYDEG